MVRCGARCELELKLAKLELNTPVQSDGYLLGLQTKMPHVGRPNLCGQFAQWSSLEDFRTVHGKEPHVLRQLQNKVKVCPACQKSCAHTMPQCNNCSFHLADTNVTGTDNVLMAFIFGIQKGRFPFTISIRACNEEVLVFDDPLCVSVCHLNVVPTGVYIPDLRYLFKDPLRGRRIVQRMLDEVDNVCLEQHWSDDLFRKTYFANKGIPDSATLKFMGTAGMNFPPSQQQLHLQYVHGPMLPFQYAVFKNGLHLQYRRFFPVQFLLDTLDFGDAVQIDVEEDTEIDEIIRQAAAVGVDYDSYWNNMCAQVNRIQSQCAPWKEEDFLYRVVGSKAYDIQTGQEMVGTNIKAVQAADVQNIQSYGWSSDDGSPSMGFYPFAKRAAEIESWQ